MPPVIDMDRSWVALRGRLKSIGESEALYVGIQGQNLERDEGGPTNAEIGTWHEFGTTTGVPERSFLRATLDAGRERYAAMMQRGLGLVVDGVLRLDQVLGLLGEKVVLDVRKRIRDGIAPELKPETIRRKTRADGATASTPLVLTTQLIRSISWLIRKPREDEGT